MKRRPIKARGYTTFWLLLDAVLLVSMAFAYGIGSNTPEMAQVIADAQHRPPNQFDMVMEDRETHPPEARTATALPGWYLFKQPVAINSNFDQRLEIRDWGFHQFPVSSPKGGLVIERSSSELWPVSGR